MDASVGPGDTRDGNVVASIGKGALDHGTAEVGKRLEDCTDVPVQLCVRESVRESRLDVVDVPYVSVGVLFRGER